MTRGQTGSRMNLTHETEWCSTSRAAVRCCGSAWSRMESWSCRSVPRNLALVREGRGVEVEGRWAFKRGGHISGAGGRMSVYRCQWSGVGHALVT